MESGSSVTSGPNGCVRCQKAPPEVRLKHCAKCWTISYCSRQCQKDDWKNRKKVCGKNPKQATSTASSKRGTDAKNLPSSSTLLSPPKGLDSPISKPFIRIDNGTYLHDRPEKDVYRVLIDAYRLRVEDNYKLESDADADSIYGGEANGLKGFRRFMKLAKKRPGLLPPWWTDAKQQEAEALGL